MEAKQILVPISSQNSTKAALVNCVPLSVMMQFTTPDLVKMPRMNFTTTVAVIFRTGSASGHLVNLSMATNKN